jgi:hypothetical protein
MAEARMMAAHLLAEAGAYPAGRPLNQGLAGVVTPKPSPLIRRSSIHHNGEYGLWVHHGVSAAAEESRITDNALVGVWVDDRSELSARRSLIQRNGWEAVRLTAEAAALVEDCDLRANGQGAWAVEQGCRLWSDRNQE